MREVPKPWGAAGKEKRLPNRQAVTEEQHYGSRRGRRPSHSSLGTKPRAARQSWRLLTGCFSGAGSGINVQSNRAVKMINNGRAMRKLPFSKGDFSTAMPAICPFHALAMIDVHS